MPLAPWDEQREVQRTRRALGSRPAPSDLGVRGVAGGRRGEEGRHRSHGRWQGRHSGVDPGYNPRLSPHRASDPTNEGIIAPYGSRWQFGWRGLPSAPMASHPCHPSLTGRANRLREHTGGGWHWWLAQIVSGIICPVTRNLGPKGLPILPRFSVRALTKNR